MFTFWLVVNRGLIPFGGPDDGYKFNLVCKDYGLGCTAWVITNENFDYLKCPDEIGVTLDWDKSSKCTTK